MTTPPSFRNGRLLALALAFVCVGCSGATTSTTPGEAAVTNFALTSPSFDEGGAIPIRHTCDGVDISPALAWQGAPSGTAAFALIVDDPDAQGFVHWIVIDIPGGTSGSLVEGLKGSDPLTQGYNDFGKTGYGGPCPPGGTHHYRFTLWALSARLNLSGTITAFQAQTALKPLVLAQTTLTGVYTRQ